MHSQQQAYFTNLKNFYLAVICNHPKSIQLTNSFHKIIVNFTTHSQHTISLTHANSHSHSHYQQYHNQNNYMMNKNGSTNNTNNSNKKRQENRENMKNKQGLSRMLSINNIDKLNNYYGIYSNQHFAATFIFGYIYTIIKDENQQILKMISTKINLLCQYQLNYNININGNTATLKQQKTKLQNYLSDWKKIIKVVQHKGTFNWYRILCSTFIGFDYKFIQIISRSVLSLNSKNKLQLNQNIQIIRVISNQLKISTNLVYFKGEEVKDKKMIGRYKNTIIIGVHPRSKSILYAFYQKLPGHTFEPQPTSTRVLKTKATINTYDEQQKNSAISKQSNDVQIKIRINSIKKQLKGQKSLKEVKSAVYLKKFKSLQDIQSPIKIIKASQYKLIKRKTLMNVKLILKEYQLNTVKLDNLQCFYQRPFRDIQEKNEIQRSRSQKIKNKQ